MVEDIKDDCAACITAVQARDATWFNANAYYNSVMSEAINLKRLALGKVELWRDDPKASVWSVKMLSLRAADQQAQSRKKQLLQEAKAAACVNTCRPFVVTWWCGPRASDSETVKKLALQLCADQGLLVALVYDTFGEMSLMRQAALGAAPAAILLLVDAGADLRALDSQGAIALHRAAQSGHMATVRVLARECGADVKAATQTGSTVVMMAARNGHTATVVVLAQECGADVTAATQDGFTALMSAVQEGHMATVVALAQEYGADVNAAKQDGFTALMSGAQNRHTATVVALAQECGADVNAADEDGFAALMSAAEEGHTATVVALAQEWGADVNAPIQNGFTALMSTAHGGHTATVVALAQECGADVNAAKQDGFTALMSAAHGGHTATVVALAQECGADVNAADDDGFTALMSAAQNGRTATVVALAQECGADGNAAQQNGFTALLIAAGNRYTATVVALAQECRAEVNAALQNGETALMLAAQEGHQDTVLCLVTALKANVGASNSAGASCLHAMAVSSWAATSAVMAPEDQVHHDAGCDGCEMCPIRGPRWKCTDCPSYDLCKTYHTQFTDTGDHHTAGHVFENVAVAAAAKVSAMTAVLLEHVGIDMLLRTDSAFGWTQIHYVLYTGNEALARSLVDRLCSGSGNSSEVFEWLGNAKQDVLRHMGAPLSLFRSLPSAVKAWQDDGVVAFRSFCSVRSNFCCPPGAWG